MTLSSQPKANTPRDSASLQFDANGQLHHLLTLDGFSKVQITSLLDQADGFLAKPGQAAIRNDSLKGITVGNLFFEASTRTRASFELAAKRLGADVLNLDVNVSSRKKGESILDTIYTLEAMQVDVFVVRDASAGVPAMIARNLKPHTRLLNAGESDVAHPTQGLLDLLTIRQHRADFENLTVAIIGDIAHSRVARSAAAGLAIMGVGELRLVSPPSLAPAPESIPGARLTHDLEEGIRGADVVMALRIQKERIASLDDIPGVDEYLKRYGLSEERMSLAAPGAIVMHPGPMNRGIEIESKLADSPRSVITKQVTNGVAVRMAVLTAVAGGGRVA